MGACRTTRSLCAIEIFVFARTLAANARQPQVVEGPNFSHWAFCKSPRKTEVTEVDPIVKTIFALQLVNLGRGRVLCFCSPVFCIKDHQQPSWLWESGNPRFLRISKRGGKVRFLDFSTERLFHSPFAARFVSLFQLTLHRSPMASDNSGSDVIVRSCKSESISQFPGALPAPCGSPSGTPPRTSANATSAR